MKSIISAPLCSLLFAFLACSVSPSAVAKETPAAEPMTVIVPRAQSTLPAGTLVALRVDQDLKSQTSKRGDKFSISLAHDIWLNDRIAIPAGTKGVGEVIHSSGKGFGGRAGELIVAARYLEVNGQQIPLKNFKLGVAGADNAHAALFSSLAIPIAGMFVTGTSATIGIGQLAQAKLAQTYSPPSAQQNGKTQVTILPAEE